MKIKEVSGDPFEAIIEDINTVRINENEYITTFQILNDLDDSFYKNLNHFKELKDFSLQLYLKKEIDLLLVKFKIKSKDISFKTNDKLKKKYEYLQEKIRLSNLKLKEISLEEYSNYISQDLNLIIEELNKKFKKSKPNLDNIEFGKYYYQIITIREYPNHLNLKKIKKLADINIKLKYKSKEKNKEIYNQLKTNLEKIKEKYDEKFKLTSNKAIYPYQLKKRIAKLDKIKEYNLVGIELKLIIKAKNKDDLNKKYNKLNKLTRSKFNINRLSNNLKRETLANYLYNIKNSKFRVLFYKDNDYKYCKNIKTQKSSDEKGFLQKTLSKILNLNSKNKNKYIYIKNLYENGIFELEDGSFSAIYKSKNINYELEKESYKEDVVSTFEDFINIINRHIKATIYIRNSKKNLEKLKSDLFIKENQNKYIKDYNKYLANKLEESAQNSSNTDYYIIINLDSENIVEADEENERVYQDIKSDFRSIKSDIEKLSAKEIENFFYNSLNRPSKNNRLIQDLDYQVNFNEKIAPVSFSIKRDCLIHENKYHKVVYVSEYANDLGDDFVSEIANLPFELDLAINISLFEKPIKNVEEQIVNMENEKKNKKTKNKMKGNEGGYIPFDLENNLDNANYTLKKLKNDDQRLYKVGFYISIYAESEKELKTREKILKTKFSKNAFEFAPVFLRQKQGLNSTLLGKNFTKQDKELLTENLSYLHAFDHADLYQKDGFFFGLSESNDPIVLDRKEYDNTSAFILGVSGSGKSLLKKLEILEAYFNSDDHIIIIDPEREFNEITKAINGEVIKLSTNTNNFINVMGIPNYSQDEIAMKIEFVITFIEKLTGNQLSSSKKSIIDRCLRKIYTEFAKKERDPILDDLYNSLKNQNEDLADEIALDIEIYVKGSLDIFAKQSNVNLDNRVICFDIKDLREQLRPSAITVVLDSIWERLNENREKGIYTRVDIDEFHLLGKDESSSEWLLNAWKRVRKYRGMPTGITQNISDLLKSQELSAMLSNSEIKIIMKQKDKDRKKLVEDLGLSEKQKKKITNAQSGTGLLIAGDKKMPFNNRFKPSEIPNLFNLIETD